MILGVMSDTHGHMEFMKSAAKRMIEDFEVESIIHLGDDYSDAMKLSTSEAGLIAVPGMYEPAWDDKSISHRLIRRLGGISFLMTHTPKRDPGDRVEDINPESAREKHGIEVLLHGHTHQHRAEKLSDGVVIINPGHLKSEKDRGFAPTFAIIDAKKPRISVKIIEILTGKLVEDHDFTIDSGPDSVR